MKGRPQEIVGEGYLLKRPQHKMSRMAHKWLQRWYVLGPTEFRYYGSDHKTQLKGRFTLHKVTDILLLSMDAGSVDAGRFSLVHIENGKRVKHLLKAPSVEVASHWVQALRVCVQAVKQGRQRRIKQGEEISATPMFSQQPYDSEDEAHSLTREQEAVERKEDYKSNTQKALKTPQKESVSRMSDDEYLLETTDTDGELLPCTPRRNSRDVPATTTSSADSAGSLIARIGAECEAEGVEKWESKLVPTMINGLFAEMGQEGMEWLSPELLNKELTMSMTIRFLRARNHGIKEATAFILEHLKWRKATLPIPADEVTDELKKGKYQLINGFDLNGHRTLVIHSKRMGKHTYTDFDNMVRAIVFALEKLCNNIGPLETFTVIVSRIDSGRKNLDLDWAKGVAGVIQNNYPERLFKAMVTPVSFAFRGVWRIAKLFFDPITASKIELLASPEELKNWVPPAVLPVNLGGEYDEEFKVEDVLNFGKEK